MASEIAVTQTIDLHGHEPDQTTWNCLRCGKPAPCDPVRELLAQSSNGEVLLSLWFQAAVESLPGHPLHVWVRFVGWWRQRRAAVAAAESGMPQLGPELARANLLLLAERLGWPDGIPAECQQLIDDFPYWSITWSVGGLRRWTETGYYAWPRDSRLARLTIHMPTGHELRKALESNPEPNPRGSWRPQMGGCD